MKIYCSLLAIILSLSVFAGKKPPTPALYPGGEPAMKKYLHDSIRYPESDRRSGIEGVVFVSFVVGTNGLIESAKPKVMLGGSLTLQAEAIRLVMAMPQWTPATSKGKPASSMQTAEVRFELPDSLIKFPAASDTNAVQGDVMPVFMGGGEWAMQMYIQLTMQYPRIELEQGKQGMVFVSFIVGKNGMVSDVAVVKSVPGAPGLSREAERIVGSFPRFTPGTRNGEPVKVQMTIPLKFVLQ